MSMLLAKLSEIADDIISQMEAIETRASERADGSFTESEDANLTELRSQLEATNKRIESAQVTAESMRKVAAFKQATEVTQKATETNPEKRNIGNSQMPSVKVTDPDVYHDGNKGLFLKDIIAHYMPGEAATMRSMDGEHQDRLTRYRKATKDDSDIKRRAVATSNLAGIVIPNYRRDLVAPGLYDGRVVASLARQMSFPNEGVQIIIPRVTTKAAFAVQSAEQGAISETSPRTGTLTVDMTTIAAYADVSLQAIEQGAMTEQILMEELQMEYADTIEDQVINGSGSSGQVTGLRNVGDNTDVTYNDTSVTFAEAWPKFGSLITETRKARKKRPDCLVFSNQTWAWLSFQLDKQNRPLFTPMAQGPYANIGVGDVASADATMPMPVGTLMGINCYVSDKVGESYGADTNQSEVYAFRREDLLIGESSMMPTIIPQLETSSLNLEVRFTAYSFLFWTAGRHPEGIGVLAGTGMDMAL